MATILDDEFGVVTVRRSAKASHVRIRIAPNGTLRASMPMYAPIFMLKRLIKNSRDELREMISKQQPAYHLENGMVIGKSHTLVVKHGASRLSVDRHGQQIIAQLPDTLTLADEVVIVAVRDIIIKALRVEAKSYLPKRLAYLATQLEFGYERVRFSHSSGRWGSCSSTGTISLNIALMKLPHELIDYVLVHELCHTEQMNHSEVFWSLVSQGDPLYKTHRKVLKGHSPSI
ncbi:MAG: M48 family peptidase [Chloroflexi bacterium]|nr:MAG: M48 family peptidase [Chloroflexota bacterium]